MPLIVLDEALTDFTGNKIFRTKKQPENSKVMHLLCYVLAYILQFRRGSPK